MYKIFFLTLIIFSLISCGKNKLKSDKKDDTYVGAFEKLDSSKNRLLDANEKKFANDICDALESNKNFLFRSVGEEYRFSFERHSKICGGQIRQIADHAVRFVAPININTPLAYRPLNGVEVDGFRYDILTDEYFVIKKLCDKSDLNLIQEVSGGFVKFRFYNPGVFEYFLFTKSGDDFVATRFENIQANINSNLKRYGMVETRISGAFCNDGSQAFNVNSMK